MENQRSPCDDIIINVDEIPNYKTEKLHWFVMKYVEKLFSDPETEERYQKWLAERQAKAAAGV